VREFVQEHLGAFVWVRHLDARDEADRSFIRVVGDEQVVTGFGEEPRGCSRVAWAVE